MSKVTNFKKSGFTPKEKANIVDLSKEIKIDKIEAESIKTVSEQLDNLSISVGMLRVDFVMKEKNLIANMQKLQSQLMANMKNIEAKYKIIGRIKSVDYEKNLIILE